MHRGLRRHLSLALSKLGDDAERLGGRDGLKAGLALSAFAVAIEEDKVDSLLEALRPIILDINRTTLKDYPGVETLLEAIREAKGKRKP